jgi:hypothetical protein
VLVVCALAACDPSSDRSSIGQIEYHDAPCKPEPPAPPADEWGAPVTPGAAVRRFAAFTSTGELAVVGVETAEVLAQAPADPASAVRDLDWDAAGGRLVLFESDEHEQGGEIAAHAVDVDDASASLGTREHLAWVDGIARIAASSLGVLVFEDGFGPRWRVLWNDGNPGASVAAPRPASMWLEAAADGFAVHALTYGVAASDVSLERRRTQLVPDSIVPIAAPLLDVAAATDPPTARSIAAPAIGAELLADVIDGTPALRVVHGALVGEASPLFEAGAVERIEALATLDGGRMVLLLTSAPARLLAAHLDDEGNVLSEDALDLPGNVRQELQFFSRDLIVLGPTRALVATDAGVFAVSVAGADGSPALDIDPAFAGLGLRGPLVALPDAATLAQ